MDVDTASLSADSDVAPRRSSRRRRLTTDGNDAARATTNGNDAARARATATPAATAAASRSRETANALAAATGATFTDGATQMAAATVAAAVEQAPAQPRECLVFDPFCKLHGATHLLSAVVFQLAGALADRARWQAAGRAARRSASAPGRRSEARWARQKPYGAPPLSSRGGRRGRRWSLRCRRGLPCRSPQPNFVRRSRSSWHGPTQIP